MPSLDAGRVVTVQTRLRRVWAKRENAGLNLVRIFVWNLRLKLGDSAAGSVLFVSMRVGCGRTSSWFQAAEALGLRVFTVDRGRVSAFESLIGVFRRLLVRSSCRL